ncbi:AmmeMemoRadiSam system protein B [Thalassovita aquimarina]|uniref:AmmeMemoRadiSam system protein B n=1 Tax=Thalassovita aquimarina TaxID=2785917 RepID=A0ABS5HRH0_9RHOB|nr:AmmeMemoRadiSam system protein B [Thalassovita aquimarina]MBR9651572.1 AmmeMemoRadiSam system protein B [Thalassovita aquimarina]
MSERSCQFAGLFFPADSGELASEVGAFLRSADAPAGAAQARAIVSAHAGYPYSGGFAGQSFGAVGWTPARVVVLSPSHRHPFRGVAFPSQDVFATPLGPLRIDRAACTALAEAGFAHEEDAAHDSEHGIETQLPFIRTLWSEARIVPLVCGDVPAEQVAATIDALDGPETLFVLSSDLSHFLTRSDARKRDAETAHLLETGKWDEMTPSHACGAKAIQGWLLSRAGQGAKALRLGMGDSAEVTGDRSRVVGYGAWAFYPIDAAMLNDDAQADLLGLARDAIAGRMAGCPAAAPDPGRTAMPLQTRAASFVTLTQNGALRGCIGSVAARRALAQDVAENAVGAAFRDPRFMPVSAGELPELRIKVAVLSKAQEMQFDSEEDALSRIEPGLDGLFLSSAGRRGLFLPAVWDSIPDPRDFLDALKRKAGLPLHHWAGDVTLHRFRVESFGDAAD